MSTTHDAAHDVQHHPPGELLMEYAAGVGLEAHALLIACHLTYCPSCRNEVAAYEALGGALLGELPEVAPSPGGSMKLEGIEKQDRLEAESPRRHDPLFPAPLVEIAGASSELKWKRMLPGVHVVELPLLVGARPARLVRTVPGLGVPMHRHKGRELDLVLQGGLRDHVRQNDYEPGDVQYADESVEHRISVLPGQPCILLSMHEEPAEGISLWAKLLYKFVPL